MKHELDEPLSEEENIEDSPIGPLDTQTTTCN